jgi:DNA-binding SARP family transcriptional activator
VRVCLLGPFQVLDSDGRQVPITAPMLRATLAVLALQAGDPVSSEALAKALWGDDWAEKRKPGTVKNNIKRIRGLMPPDSLRLSTYPAGYCLDLAPDECDLTQFDALRKAGLTAAATGDWPGAARLLSQAESLWRGDALADIDLPLRDEHAPYLHAQRLSVQETRCEAEIRLSLRGSAATLPDLQRLIAANPGRENLATWGMIALYRAGQQAAALTLYRETAAHLRDDHGLDPGPALRWASDQILAASPFLLNQPLTGGFPF